MADKIREAFMAAHEKSCSIIKDYLTSGYVKDFAKMLIYIGKENAEEVLSKMPEELAQQTREQYEKYSDKKITDAEVISTAGPVLKKAGFYGFHMADEVIHNIPKEELHKLIQQTDSFFEIDPLIAMNIEQNSFTFNDLVLLDNRAIQKVLREVDQVVAAKALRNAEPEVQEKIFNNMSNRAAQMLKEDMEFMGPVRLVDVLAAQNEIVNIVLRLEDNGDIVIQRSSEDELV